MSYFAFFIISVITLTSAKNGFGPTEQEWGFVTVRPGAEIFWWLHQTSAPVKNYTERPLVIFLEGGPGESSTGFSNFYLLGPLDYNLNPRNNSWINDVNVLFVDNPVGTGYSRVNSTQNLATNNSQIAEDFLVFMQEFYNILPELKATPLYIFAESYGGKMTVDIALVLDRAIKNGTLEANLGGIGLGDSWISPIDTTVSMAPYLLNLGLVDQKGYKDFQAMAEKVKEAIETEDYVTAMNLRNAVVYQILQQTWGADIFNILTKVGNNGDSLTDKLEKIGKLMNNEVKDALGLNASWGNQSNDVFQALFADFMSPVFEKVEEILNNTDMKVIVYSGQLDLTGNTMGTLSWVNKLKFPEANAWKIAKRESLVVDNIIEGYYKKAGKLAFYWVNRSGHMVAADNPAAMLYILNDTISSS